MVTVCETCGEEGFFEALVYCDACKVGAVHRYCSGIMPVPIDDYVIWFCAECEESDAGFDCKEVDQVAILTKSEKKKEENSNHTPPGLDVEHHEVQDSSNGGSVEVSSAPPVVETMEEPERREISCSSKYNKLTGLVGNEAFVSEAGDGASVSVNSEKEQKKKKKPKSVNHSLPDATNVEPLEVSEKQDESDSRNSDELNGRDEVSVLEKCEKKEEEKSSNHPSPVSVVKYATNAEPLMAQESSASGKPLESAGLAKNGPSVSEGGNSSTVPDHNSCTTSKKRRLSSGNIRVTSENTQLAADNISCKEAESNMRQTDEVLTATDFNSPVLNNNRALPIFKPIWRGSISVKHGNIRSVDGLVAHMSSLACHKVHEKASSFHACLTAEMCKRLEIWPESFLKNGPPTDESVALYFFPSRDSKEKKVYYSLVDDMKKYDLAMKCVLDNVELLLFTSYQLPMDSWQFHSKEYLWGIFRRRKTSRR